MRRVEKQNIRVVVELEDPWLLFDKSPEALERARLAIAERVKKEVLRHVDDINGVAIAWDLVTVCGGPHGGAEGDGNLLGRFPECCYDDQLDFVREHAAETDEWFIERGCDDPDYLLELRERVAG